MSQNETKCNYFSPPFHVYSLALNDVIYCSSTLNILRVCLVRSGGGGEDENSRQNTGLAI